MPAEPIFVSGGGRYMVDAGVTLEFDRSDGIRVADYGAPTDVLVAGELHLTQVGLLPYSSTTNGIEGHQGRIEVASTGAIRMDNGGGFIGIEFGSFGFPVINNGLISIEARGWSMGIESYGMLNDLTPAITNNGAIRLIAPAGVGIELENVGKVVNTGLVTVTGTSVTGVDIFMEGGFYNGPAGEIHAVATDASHRSIGVSFLAQIYGTTAYAKRPEIGSFINEGVVSGDVALKVGAFTESLASQQVFQNPGRLIGDVEMTGGGQTLRNSGLVDGRVSLGDGDDIYEGAGGRVTVQVAGGEGADSLTGGDVFDYLQGNAGRDRLFGMLGDDWVVGGKDGDLLDGGSGADVLNGNLGDDSCDGGAGADVVRGGQGNDTLTGSDGDDWLSGDRGDDTLRGGAGADTFHAFGDAEKDTVVDFHVNEGDRVQLDAGTSYTVSQVGADTVVAMVGGAQLVLQGVQMSALQPGWILA